MDNKEVRTIHNTISKEALCAEYEAVYRYVLTLCRNDIDAQDITQETFLKAMSATRTYKGKASLYTWLCTIARNNWINRCKKENREQPTDCMDPYSSNNNKSLETMLEEKDLSIHIHRILHHMEEPYKEVFSLRTFGELPFADIGTLFSRSENWARVTYHRSKKQIIEILGKDGLL